MQALQPPLISRCFGDSDSEQTLNIFADQDWNDVLPFYSKDVKNRWGVSEQMAQLLMCIPRFARSSQTLPVSVS